MSEALWAPSPERAAASALGTFAAETGHEDYLSLHRWSVEQPAEFWSEVWDRTGVIGEKGSVSYAPGDSMIGARFFPEARLNVAETILRGKGSDPEAPMLVSTDECGRRRSFTRAEVAAEVAAMAAMLRDLGVGVGDCVAAWMPNVAETMVAMLAAASVGAVFSSTSPDFGTDGVLDRFGQISPKVLFAADGYFYGGKQLDCLDRLDSILDGLPTVQRVVVVGNLEWDGWGGNPELGAHNDQRILSWKSAVAPHAGAAEQFERLPFDHPWYVLFSSGTTGVPKCIIHRCGGVLIQHLKEHQYHCDIGTGDAVFYYSTCGWMMWNWLASVPASGATAILFDGYPFHPDPLALPGLVAQEKVTFFGVSAKYLDSLKKAEVTVDEVDLGSLRTIASTGSPLAPETFEWVYSSFVADAHLASISGGTDLCACFVAGDPTSAVFAGEIQRAALGMAVDVWDENQRSTGPGERGELVCTRAFPSMPLGFWGDPDGSRYAAAYFEKYPNVWSQGDFASWTDHGGIVLHGRSDTTLNPGGVRIGTAEIYRRVEQFAEIQESLVFGQEWQGDVRIVLLVRMTDGAECSEELQKALRTAIRTGCTPRHVPAVIAAVPDLPRTRSGKLAELAVSDVVNGRPVRNTGALANPEVLADLASLPALTEI